MVAMEKMHDIAMSVAKDNKESEPNIQRIFWFPHTEEVRLVEVDPEALPSDSRIVAFHFGPGFADGVSIPSAIALIRPQEVGVVALPEGWGSWEDAKELQVGTN
ncbi:MAG: hypothetical protein PHU85_13780 [Phycisphaerae bacterium]|nr:hypothetical protein [Phycisphaerae bacterium]